MLRCFEEDYLLSEERRIVKERADRLQTKLRMLQDVDRENIIFLLDYDLTMASKDNPENFDEAPLKSKNYKILRELGAQIQRVIVSTARGGKSILDYLQDPDHVRAYGPLVNVFLASNSGHFCQADISDPATTFIPIPGYEKNDPPLKDVLGGIKTVMDGLKKKFPDVNTDYRELCGAVTFNKFKTQKEVDDFFAEADRLKSELPKAVADKIYFSPKSKAVSDNAGNIIKFQGYLDLKPIGMDKGLTTTEILLNKVGIDEETLKKSVIVVAGDSDSDYPMMQAVEKLVKEGKIKAAIYVDVGGLMKDPDNLIDIVLRDEKTSSAVDKLYLFLNDVVNTCVPSRKNVVGVKPSVENNGSYP